MHTIVSGTGGKNDAYCRKGMEGRVQRVRIEIIISVM